MTLWRNERTEPCGCVVDDNTGVYVKICAACTQDAADDVHGGEP